MACINMSSIMGKVNRFSKSQVGKDKIKRCIDKYMESGRSVTGAGSTIVTKQMMIQAANELISMLKDAASQYNLPKSVKAHFDSLNYTPPVRCGGTGQYRMDITFEDDLSRPSLIVIDHSTGMSTDKRTGEGVSDIVSLFDTGYDASSVAYGLWESRVEEIASLQHREGLHFLGSTIDAFNRRCGAMYHVHASLA